MKTFFITSHIYCRPRNLDASWISDYLVANGFSYTKDYSRADLIVVNTCAFRKQEENSSLRVIRYYERRRAKGARLIILGCLPAINPNVIAGLRDYSVILPSNLHEIDKIVNGRIRLTSVPERHLLSGFQQAPILSLIDNIHKELCGPVAQLSLQH